MPNLTKTTKPISGKSIKPRWHLFNIENKVLGRAASEISQVLQGKNRIDFAPYLDSQDFVVVINAKKLILTGRKLKDKIYTQYSGYPGGLRRINFERLFLKNPGEVVKRAVSGMLPKNKLRDRRIARLFIFENETHPFQDKFGKN